MFEYEKVFQRVKGKVKKNMTIIFYPARTKELVLMTVKSGKENLRRHVTCEMHPTQDTFLFCSSCLFQDLIVETGIRRSAQDTFFVYSGMNTGIQDAHNLAWKLASVINGVSPISILNSYELERSQVLISSILGFIMYMVVSMYYGFL